MNSNTEQIIKKYKQDINNENWVLVYSATKQTPELTGDLTTTLLQAGINPLNNTTEVPPFYLYNTSVSECEIPSHITAIRRFAFAHCHELKNIMVPSSVEFIDESAFEESGIVSISLPDSLVRIKDSAFAETILLSNIKIPNNVKEIPAYCFEGSGIVTAVLGDNVVQIDSRAFGECSHLEHVDLNEGLQSIRDYAFAYCPKLKSVYIPESVNAIGVYAFYRCDTNFTIYCKKNSYAHRFAENKLYKYHLV